MTSATRARHPRWVCAGLVALVVAASGALPASAAPGTRPRPCADWLGEPVPGTAAWHDADQENLRCAAEGRRLVADSPAVTAAVAANADAGDGAFVGDPFRAPNRWDGVRGTYEQVTYTDRDGNVWPAALFGPRGRRGGPHPGVVLVCHACFPLPATTENVGLWYWAAETLAEAGYVVLYATTGGNSATRAVDATDFLLATPAAPTARGEFNPWHDRLDQDRLGIIGHSGAAGVALAVGGSDSRFDAIVAWDPAASATLGGVTPRIPTMIQVADYSLRAGPVPMPGRPVPPADSKYTFYDAFRAAGVDVMQVAPRASTHLDWTRFATANPFGPSIDHGVYGEQVGAYYTLAWLDRYVAGGPAAARAKSRLTARGTDRFDRSVDRFSIGAGFFDAAKAAKGRTDEAGNVPVTIGGVPVRNLLSFLYPSRYFLRGGASECDDLRVGCR
jgi:dienelactone hydrolase